MLRLILTILVAFVAYISFTYALPHNHMEEMKHSVQTKKYKINDREVSVNIGDREVSQDDDDDYEDDEGDDDNEEGGSDDNDNNIQNDDDSGKWVEKEVGDLERRRRKRRREKVGNLDVG